MTSITFKCSLEENGKLTGDIIYVALKKPTKLETLSVAAKNVLSWDDIVFRYKDEYNDTVTITSQNELETAASLAQDSVVSLSVTRPAVVDVSCIPPPIVATQTDSVAPASTSNDKQEAMSPNNANSQIKDLFASFAKQMESFASCLSQTAGKGIHNMSVSIQNNFTPLDITLSAARDDPLGKNQNSTIVTRLPDSVVHPGIECAVCHKKPLTGMRYKCVQCECNLCQDCVFVAGAHTEGHQFLPICAPAVGSFFVDSAIRAGDSVKVHAMDVISRAYTKINTTFSENNPSEDSTLELDPVTGSAEEAFNPEKQKQQ